MSFASQAREEIARRSLQKDCCVRAAAYGIACFAKYFDASGLVLQTEQELTTQVASQLFARCGVQGDIIEKQRPSGVVYEFSIRAPGQVARMHELFGTTGTETSLQIDPRLIRCQTCVSAYIGAAFLCSGTVTDPQKEYNIEFLTSRLRSPAGGARVCTPPHPPQRREPCLRQELRQRGAHPFLYGGGRGIGPAQRPEGCQADAQPNQPPHQL